MKSLKHFSHWELANSAGSPPFWQSILMTKRYSSQCAETCLFLKRPHTHSHSGCLTELAESLSKTSTSEFTPQHILILALWIVPLGLWLWSTSIWTEYSFSWLCFWLCFARLKNSIYKFSQLDHQRDHSLCSVNEPCAEIWHLALTSIFSF